MLNKIRENKTLVLFLIIVLAIVYFSFLSHKNDNNYSVVYLATGEVYVGKLTTFPNMQLKDAYIFQVIKDTIDPTKSNFQLNPVNEALWAPKEIHLNKEQVVFYGPLSETSKIAETLVGKGK